MNWKMYKNRAGYTLLETILVLCIVGLIIGAIWMGYSTATRMQNDVLEDQQISDMLNMARGYLAQYNENNTTIYPYATQGSRHVITDLFVNNNLLPTSVSSALTNSQDDGNSYQIETRYGRNDISAIPSSGNPYGTGPLIQFGFYNFNNDGCVDILSAWAGSPERVQKSALVAVMNTTGYVNPSDITGGNLLTGTKTNLSTQDIQTACINNKGTEISLFFRLNP